MKDNFQIRIYNHSNNSETYFLIQAPPESHVDMTTSVYAQSPRIQSGQRSQVTFGLSRMVFAVCGTASVTKGANVSSSSPADVKLGSDLDEQGTLKHLTTIHGSPIWTDELSTMKIKNGFAIQTDESIEPTKWNIYIGVGALDPFSEDNVVPIAAVAARPRAKYTFRPKFTYYVCTSRNFVEGTFIDIAAIEKSAAMVNFDEEPFDLVAFEHTANGEFKRRISFF